MDFFKYIKKKDKKSKVNYYYVLYIIVSTIPACIFGIFLKEVVKF